VSSIEQFFMAKSAEGAFVPIRSQHAFPKRSLVQTLAHRSSDVAPSHGVTAFVHGKLLDRGNPCVSRVVHRDCECESVRIIRNHKHGPRSDVSTRDHAVKVDQRKALLHREPQTAVLMMFWINSSVSVAQESVWLECVVVRAFGSRGD